MIQAGAGLIPHRIIFDPHKESVRNTGGPTTWSGMINRTPARDRPGAVGMRRGS